MGEPITDFSVDPTPEQLKTYSENTGLSLDQAKRAWEGQRVIQARQQTMTEGGPGPIGQFKRFMGQQAQDRTTQALRMAPGLIEGFGGTPEGAGQVAGTVTKALLPGTTGEAVADALLLGRGLMTRSGKLGARLLTGVTQPLLAGAGQAAIDTATGERTPNEAMAQGAFRTLTQGVGDLVGSASTRGLSRASAQDVGALISPVFPNAGKPGQLAEIAGEVAKPRMRVTLPNGGDVHWGLDEIESMVKHSIVPQPDIPPGYIVVPSGTGVASKMVNRPRPSSLTLSHSPTDIGSGASLAKGTGGDVALPGDISTRHGALNPATGAIDYTGRTVNQEPLEVAKIEDVIEWIRHRRGQVRKAMETTDPLASEPMIKWRNDRDQLIDAVKSQLTSDGNYWWRAFDDLSRKSMAIRDLLQVGGVFKASTTPGIDLAAIHKELTNFTAGKTPLMKKLEDAGLLNDTLDTLYRAGTGEGRAHLGSQDVSYGPLRVFSMLAGTGAAGGLPVGKVTSRIGRLPGALPAVTAGTTVELGRQGREFFTGNSLVSFPDEVR